MLKVPPLPSRRRLLLVTWCAVLVACDPEPPYRIGLSRSEAEGITVHIRQCFTEPVYALYVTRDVATLVAGEVIPASIWGFEADGSARALDSVTIGQVPTGYHETGPFDSAALEPDMQVVVYFDEKLDSADTEILGELVQRSTDGEVYVNRRPVDSETFDRCEE